MLDEIIKNNPELVKHPSIIPLVHKIETLIPENTRENFYRNLKTLRIEFSATNELSNYNFSENKIVINPNFKQYLSKNDLEGVNEQYLLESTMCHELLHMASTKCYDELELIHSGLAAYTPDGKNLNVYLNEGCTEMLAQQFYPNAVLNSGYSDVTDVVYILTNLVGIDAIKNIYFSNGLAIRLQKALGEIANEEEVKKLFNYIELLFWNKNNDENYTWVLESIIFNYLKPITIESMKKGFKNGIFKSQQDLENYYQTYLKFHFDRLINKLRIKNFNPLLLKDDLENFNTENFGDNFPDLFSHSLKGGNNNLGYISIFTLLIIFLIILGIVLGFGILNF